MKVELKSVDEVAYFRCSNAEVVSTRFSKETGRDTVFFTLEVVCNEEEFLKMKSEFLNRKTKVEPRLYSEMLRDTNNILFDELRKKRNGNGEKHE